MRYVGTIIAGLFIGASVIMAGWTIRDIANRRDMSGLSGLEPDVIYTIERLDSLDGKLIVIVSKPGIDGEKVLVRTMLPELYTKPEGSHFMLPSDEDRLVRVYDLD